MTSGFHFHLTQRRPFTLYAEHNKCQLINEALTSQNTPRQVKDKDYGVSTYFMLHPWISYMEKTVTVSHLLHACASPMRVSHISSAANLILPYAHGYLKHRGSQQYR